MKMNAQATKLQAAENDLKQLMADVTRAIEKAQQAVATIASKAAAATNRDRIHLALERILMIRVARQLPADVPFATHPLCTLRVRRCRRLTQHSLPGGPLRPYLGRTFTD